MKPTNLVQSDFQSYADFSIPDYYYIWDLKLAWLSWFNAFPVEKEKKLLRNRWCMWAKIREFGENKAGSFREYPNQ
jgi:hypothetical protein